MPVTTRTGKNLSVSAIFSKNKEDEESIPDTLLAIDGFPSATFLRIHQANGDGSEAPALTQVRMANTRMKDYFDLWLLSKEPELNQATLREAIREHLKIETWRLSRLHRALQALLKRSALRSDAGEPDGGSSSSRSSDPPILAYAGYNDIR
jgi:hypothetical protein